MNLLKIIQYIIIMFLLLSFPLLIFFNICCNGIGYHDMFVCQRYLRIMKIFEKYLIFLLPHLIVVTVRFCWHQRLEWWRTSINRMFDRNTLWKRFFKQVNHRLIFIIFPFIIFPLKHVFYWGDIFIFYYIWISSVGFCWFAFWWSWILSIS